jgi:hypothetical protein
VIAPLAPARVPAYAGSFSCWRVSLSANRTHPRIKPEGVLRRDMHYYYCVINISALIAAGLERDSMGIEAGA